MTFIVLFFLFFFPELHVKRDLSHFYQHTHSLRKQEKQKQKTLMTRCNLYVVLV